MSGECSLAVRRASSRSAGVAGQAPVAARLLLGTLLMVLLASPARAASCAQSDVRTDSAVVDVIVTGVVVGEGPGLLRLRVDRVLKGSTRSTITVFPGDYDIPSPVQTLYLRSAPLGYTARLCGGSHPGEPTRDEVSLLGAGRAPLPDDPGLGPLGNAVAILASGLGLGLVIRRLLRGGLTGSDGDRVSGERGAGR